MRITVDLFGFLADYGPERRKAFPLEIDGMATAGWLIGKLAMPPDLQLMVLINGQRVEITCPLNDGDEVFIFSPVAGG
jgi:molybdopterin converting factor small subunit